MCSWCGWRVEPLERLCNFCSAPIALTADSCDHCNRDLPVVVGRSYRYVVCGGCGDAQQLDDWMAERHHPYLFRTPAGKKVETFRDLDAAARIRWQLFNPDSWSLERCRAQLEKDDRPAWKFTNDNAARTYLNRFPCLSLTCGARAWDLSVGETVRRAIRDGVPHVGRAIVWLSGKIIHGGRLWIKKSNEQAKASWAARQKSGGKKKGGK